MEETEARSIQSRGLEIISTRYGTKEQKKFSAYRWTARRTQVGGRGPRCFAGHQCHSKQPKPGEWARHGPARWQPWLPSLPSFGPSPAQAQASGLAVIGHPTACARVMCLSPLLPCTCIVLLLSRALLTSSFLPPALLSPNLSRYQAVPQARELPERSPPPQPHQSPARALYTTPHPRHN